MAASKTCLYGSDITFLDPTSCDSTLGYHIESNKYLSGTVDLSDCNKKITWYFSNTDRSEAKIDKAIEVLTAFKKEFVKARAAFIKKNAKRKRVKSV